MAQVNRNKVVVRKLAAAFFVLAMLGLPRQGAHAETTLSGAEIQQVLTGYTALYDAGERQYFEEGGFTPYLDGGQITHGRWEVRGDQYCSVWPPNPAWACFDVVRHADGDVSFISRSGRTWRAEMVEGVKFGGQ